MALCAKVVFQIQPPISRFNFSNNISVPRITWHTLWSLLTIKLKDESIHDSIEWSGLYLQVNISPWLWNVSDLQCPDYWNKHFVKLLFSWYDLDISPPLVPYKFSPQNLSPMKRIWKKVPSPHTLGERRQLERVFQNRTESKRN